MAIWHGQPNICRKLEAGAFDITSGEVGFWTYTAIAAVQCSERAVLLSAPWQWASSSSCTTVHLREGRLQWRKCIKVPYEGELINSARNSLQYTSCPAWLQMAIDILLANYVCHTASATLSWCCFIHHLECILCLHPRDMNFAALMCRWCFSTIQ